MPAIAALGDVDLDLLVRVDEYPRRGEESFARDSTISLGGSAVNTAVTLTRLGFDTGLLAQVGDDDFGHRARSLIVDTGVDTGQLLVSESAPTGMNVVVVTRDGERTMLGLRGANRFYPGGSLHGFDWLHLSGYALVEEPQRSAALSALEEARRGSLPVSVDIPSGVAHRLGEGLGTILAGVSIFSVGRESLGHILPGEDPWAGLVAPAVATLAVTDGSRAFVVRRGDRSVTLSPPSVQAVDATGAGDAFVAGLVAATLWDLDLGPTAAVAAVLGAAATARPGAGNEMWDQYLLGTILDGWSDPDPEWVETARRYLAGRRPDAPSQDG